MPEVGGQRSEERRKTRKEKIGKREEGRGEGRSRKSPRLNTLGGNPVQLGKEVGRVERQGKRK
ncbi:MAG: hypothetical protein PVJ06_11915 [Desulfobacterales bacterium]